jgi:hypothetical protein
VLPCGVKTRPNRVSRNDATDGRFSSIGCSVLYLNWLRFQLRYGWREIIVAGGGTLSDMVLHLTGKRTGWEDFQMGSESIFQRLAQRHTEDA